MGPNLKMEGSSAAKISAQLNAICPIDKLPERRAWRDVCLMKLSQLKKEMDK